MKRDLHRPRALDQISAPFGIDTTVAVEHADHHPVATQLAALLDIGDHRAELQLGKQEVAAPGPDDRKQLNGGVLPCRGDHPVGRGSPALVGVRAQFNSVDPVSLCNQT